MTVSRLAVKRLLSLASAAPRPHAHQPHSAVPVIVSQSCRRFSSTPYIRNTFHGKLTIRESPVTNDYDNSVHDSSVYYISFDHQTPHVSAQWMTLEETPRSIVKGTGVTCRQAVKHPGRYMEGVGEFRHTFLSFQKTINNSAIGPDWYEKDLLRLVSAQGHVLLARLEAGWEGNAEGKVVFITHVIEDSDCHHVDLYISYIPTVFDCMRDDKWSKLFVKDGVAEEAGKVDEFAAPGEGYPSPIANGVPRAPYRVSFERPLDRMNHGRIQVDSTNSGSSPRRWETVNEKDDKKVNYKVVCGFVAILLFVGNLGGSLYWTDSNIFSPPKFTDFEITEREVVSPTCVMITVQPVDMRKMDKTYEEFWTRGTWSVEIKQPELQIARLYTPLPVDGDNYPLRFIIRKEHKGEVSGYLFDLPVKSKIQLRGPHPEVDLPEEVKEIVFLAGGTGIAPAIQAAHTLFEYRGTASLHPQNSSAPRMCIIWANRTLSELGAVNASSNNAEEKLGSPIRLELETLRSKYPGRITVDYVVDEEGTFVDQKWIKEATAIEKGVTETRKKASRDAERLLFVSGPEGFVSHLAGPKRWEGGQQVQGKVGGVIGKLDLKDWKIWKL